MSSSNPLVLVVGSGERRYREYLLASMARGRDLWLLDPSEPTWQTGYLAGSTCVDVFDTPALVQAARQVAATRPVHGLVCYAEVLILPSAHVVAALGLRGMSVEATRRCRDKLLTRQVLAAAGVAQPRSVPVTSPAEARGVAADIGYPVVLKPRGDRGSRGVVRVDGDIELERTFAEVAPVADAAENLADARILVEELLEGPEISVDGVVAKGVYLPLFLARKELGPPPYFEEAGHVLRSDDPLLRDAGLMAMLGTAHAALGVDDAFTHTEVRLTPRGPRIVEVNGRIGGDLIPYLGLLATGIDPGEVAAQVALGEAPSVSPTRSGCFGIRFCYPPADCRLGAVHVPAPDPARGIVEADRTVPIGHELRLPPAGWEYRCAFVICEAPDPETCRARLVAAHADVRVEWQPLAGRSAARTEH